MRLLVAIPCLNEAESIERVIGAIPESIPGVDRISVLVVDDGSTDETAVIAGATGAEVISHGANIGVGSSFQTALRYAITHDYDLMVNIDGDGQFDPGDISALTAPIINQEADFVSASRFMDPNLIPKMPWVKLWGNRRMSALISRLAGRSFHDVSCGFRAYSREALLQLNLHSRFTYTQETFLDLSRKQLRILEVPIRVQYFPDRRSRVASSLPRYTFKTLSTIVGFYRDYNPIPFFWTISAVFAVVATGFGGVLMNHYLRFGYFTGHSWAGFVGGFFAVLSLVFFVVGLVADLLDRIRDNQERILYLLKRNHQTTDQPVDREPGL